MNRNWTKTLSGFFANYVRTQVSQWIKENPQRRTRDDGREIRMKALMESTKTASSACVEQN